jgi:hypothetical protein
LVEALPASIFRELVDTIILCWLLIYLLISLKVTYQQGWFLTIDKFFLLGVSYSVLFVSAAIITLIISVFVL